MMMSGFGLIASLLTLIIYVGIPVLAVFLLIWVYRIKQNSDIQVEQNKEMIALLKKNNES